VEDIDVTEGHAANIMWWFVIWGLSVMSVVAVDFAWSRGVLTFEVAYLLSFNLGAGILSVVALIKLALETMRSNRSTR
jgi:hypothetical protein